MRTKKHKPHVAHILTLSLVWLLLCANADVAFSAWEPPIGIPVPSFGIDETYRMYDTGADPNVRNGALTYIDSPDAGVYTHYIDNTHGSATDTLNPYGTAAKPRLTIPKPLPVGSVVEIHNNITHNGSGQVRIGGEGTAASPIFVRGVDEPRLDLVLNVGQFYDATYIIVEGLSFRRGGVYGRIAPELFETSYISVRNCNFYGVGSAGLGIGDGGITVIKAPEGADVHHIVYYNNVVHDNGIYDIDTTIALFDRMEYATDEAAQAVWSGTGVTVTHSTTKYEGDYAISCAIDVTGDRRVSRSIELDLFCFDQLSTWIRCNASSSQIRYFIKDSSNNESYYDITTHATPNTWVNKYTGAWSPSDGNNGEDADTTDIVEVGWLGLDASVTYIFDYLFGYSDNDVGGISVGDASYVWVVDNEMYHNEMDGCQVINVNHVYIGRNDAHDNKQCALWVKGPAIDVIFSENHCYNHYGSASSPEGNQMGSQDEKGNNTDRIWFIFNTIHSGKAGIVCGDLYGTTNVYYFIGNVFYDIDNYAFGTWGAEALYIINNTIYDTKRPIYNSGSPGSTVATINNIFATFKSPGTLHIQENSSGEHTIDYNLFQDTMSIGSLSSTNELDETDPLLVNPGTDHSLQSGSPAIDVGTSSGIVQTVFDLFQSTYGIDIRKDIDGNSRTGVWDIGAYEGSSSDPNNPPPVLQAIGDKSVDENVTLTFNINATDPNGEPITYSAQSFPSGATLDSQTGDFAWMPSYTQAGSYQARFIASDGNSNDSETITITVNNVNRPPVLGAISDQSVDENDLLSFSVNATDPDGQTLTYSVSSLPNGAVFASPFTWTPSYDQAGTYLVTFTADDGQAQDSETITITVVNVNRAPMLTTIGNKTAYADVLLNFTIDAIDPDGDAITYSTGTLPSGATFTDQDFKWTPSQSQVGSYAVTFIASDGKLQDSETVTMTVDIDSLAPIVTNCSPAAGSIQVPLNNLITLNIADAGIGVNADSIKIKVRVSNNPNINTVYFGDTDNYTSPYGDCRRIGTKADYRFVYQPTSEMFYYDQTVTITVNATDLAGNVMDEYSYSFATEMHSFGQNKQVNSGLDNNDRPVTVCDSSDNIWTAWHAGPIDNRDIYISKLAAGEENFGSTIQLTNNANDQCNPAVALDSNDKLYVVWQDNREGDWDIYVSTSVDGTSWSTETRVNDPNDGNQVNPAIVIDGQNYAHVVWQDDRIGNQDICIATSSDGFATKTLTQITSNTFDQVEPAVAADSDNTIYVVWTDGRNGSNDIYGAASNNPWTNVAIVSNTDNQSSPAIATESTGSILHLLWVDDTSGDNDIYYASSSGLPGSPLTGSSIIDDTSGADQLDPTIAVTGSTDNNLKVFACWQDWRNTDTDLYFAELSAGSGTNVFVGDSGSNAEQGKPVIGIGEYDHPYIMWADNRSTNTDIYYAGSTFIEHVALASELVSASASSSTTVGTDPQAITTVDDVSIVVPVGGCLYDVAITVTKIANLPAFAAPCLGGYDFGPSGIQFSQPVTITIPYTFSGSDSSATPYWFNSLTGALSQQGITDIQDIPISSSLHALSFKTTHFTAFFLLEGGGTATIVSGGGGGGGCSVSASGEGNIVEYMLPYIVLAVVMTILKMRDARYRKARNMTAGKC
ncbi:MAG TPA: putative Ig domain-containing protein [Sedimentisphaerales bacterium]|nr:putative Ig domain-containing protein [Sedimentisphaerales bacterium]